MSDATTTIGILALQGGFAEHAASLRAIDGVECREIRKKDDFDPTLSGLILPGGESMAIAKLLSELSLLNPIAHAIGRGLPVFGTCAGMILLAAEAGAFPHRRINLLDIAVTRNAYGRQRDSFNAIADFADAKNVPMVFIRAPGIEKIGPNVEPLASVNGRIVAVRQGNILATAFHPELTSDTRVHRYFVDMARIRRDATRARNVPHPHPLC